jgi:hypothetical protein
MNDLDGPHQRAIGRELAARGRTNESARQNKLHKKDALLKGKPA